MNVLSRMLEAVRPGGVVLDLQVVPPDPRIESDGQLICEIDGGPLLDWAAAARAAIDERVARGDLAEEAVDDHDVCQHYVDGPDLVASWADKQRRLAPACAEVVSAIARPCLVRESCRLRRLRLL